MANWENEPETAALQRLKEICEGATSAVELLHALDSERPVTAGWSIFAGAEKYARSEDPADLGDAWSVVKDALTRLADSGDMNAAKLLTRFG